LAGGFWDKYPIAKSIYDDPDPMAGMFMRGFVVGQLPPGLRTPRPHGGRRELSRSAGGSPYLPVLARVRYRFPAPEEKLLINEPAVSGLLGPVKIRYAMSERIDL
jgi:hypothetical protein